MAVRAEHLTMQQILVWIIHKVCLRIFTIRRKSNFLTQISTPRFTRVVFMLKNLPTLTVSGLIECFVFRGFFAKKTIVVFLFQMSSSEYKKQSTFLYSSVL